MRNIILSFLLLSCATAFAEDQTNILAATGWSEPVVYRDVKVRGRLVLVDGSQPAYGGPATTNAMMLFVELQNLKGSLGGSLKLYFEPQELKCELFDAEGKPVASSQGGWSGPLPAQPGWVVLPYNSTIRLFANIGGKSPALIPHGGRPGDYWTLTAADTNTYSLSGTLRISSPTNSTLTVTPAERVGYHDYAEWQGELAFPKTKILPFK